MRDINKILETLPTSWDDFKLRDFKKTLNVTISDTEGIESMFDGANNTVKILSALTGLETDYFENMPMKDFALFGNRLAFMQTQPVVKKKSTIKWRDFETLPYNSYVVYMQFADKPLENMTVLIKAFAADNLTTEQVEDLSMSDFATGFFLLKKQLKKYIRHSIQSTAWKLMRVQVKNLFKLLHGKRSNKAKSKQ